MVRDDAVLSGAESRDLPAPGSEDDGGARPNRQYAIPGGSKVSPTWSPCWLGSKAFPELRCPDLLIVPTRLLDAHRVAVFGFARGSAAASAGVIRSSSSRSVTAVPPAGTVGWRAGCFGGLLSG